MDRGLLNALGKAISSRRTSLSLSQKEVAERAGLPRAYLSDVERGTRNLSLTKLAQVARALDLELSQLLSLAEENPAANSAVDLLKQRTKFLEDKIAGLRSELTNFSAVFDVIPQMVWIKDANNRIIKLNDLAAKSLGMSKEEVEGQSTYDLYPDQAEKYHQDDLEVITTGRAKFGIIEPYRPINLSPETVRWVRTDKIPFTDEAGNIIGVVVFATDITDLELTVEALKEARNSLESRYAVLAKNRSKQNRSSA